MGKGRLPHFPSLADLVGLARHIELRAVSRWVGLGLVVGLLAGLAACVLYLGFEAVRHLTLVLCARMEQLEPAGEHALFHSVPSGDVRLWALVLMPALGFFLSAWVVHRFAREAAGGNEGWLLAFHQGRGRIRRRVVPTKLLAAMLSLGSGASAGREGPIAHVGAALGAMVGRAFRLSDRERRLLLVAGAAGGIGAIFRTPLGGALFVVEVLYTDDLEVDALVPAVLSSVVAYSLFTSIFGEGALFNTAVTYNLDARELPLFALMAIFVGIVGVIFVALHHKLHAIVHKLTLWPPLIALFGGGVVGLLGLIHPAVFGAGYGWMQEALAPTVHMDLAWKGVLTMLLIAALKVVATSVTAALPISAGVFGPSVVIGGMVGGAFGLAFHLMVPQVVSEPSSFMIVGMACFVGGVTSSPLSTLVMASEMTGSYELLVPTMLAEVITFTLISKWKLYQQQVPTRRDSPAHGGEYVLDVLSGLRVKDVFLEAEVRIVERSLPLSVLLRRAADCPQAVFPVSGDDGKPEGLVTLDTVRAYLYDDDIGMLAIAADCESPFVSVLEHETLAVALERMARAHYQQLPVVRDGAGIVGLISYDDLLSAYSRELSQRRSGLSPLPAILP